MTPIASFSLPAGHPVFDGHFPDDPVVPGALLLALVEQQVNRWLGEAGSAFRVAAVASVKFTRPVRPDQACALSCEQQGTDVLRFRIEVDGSVCALGRLRLQAPEIARCSLG